MWSISRRDRCIRSILLGINCAACVAIVYTYLKYVGEHVKIKVAHSEVDFIYSEKLSEEKCIPVCGTEACVWHANLLLRNGNPAANPCDNFRSFLCHGFEQNFGPEEIGNVRTENKAIMISKLKGILDNLQSESETASAKLKTVYDSCVDYGSSELQGINDLQHFLNSLGLLNWPNLAPDFKFRSISLSTLLGNFIVYGGNNYVDFRNIPVKNKTNQDAIYEVWFSKYIFDFVTESPREPAVTILKYFDLQLEDIESIIQDYERVKSSITNLYEESSKEDCKVNCSDVHILCSSGSDYDWQHLCQMTDVILNLMNMRDDVRTFSITVENPMVEFFKNLFPLLQFLSDRSVGNFLTLNFIKTYQGELSFYFRFLKLKTYNFLLESDRKSFEMDRWRYCVQWITDNMKLPLENEFFHKYLTSTVVEEVISIYNEYKSDILDMLFMQDWIPPNIKSELNLTIKSTAFNVHHLSQILPNDTHVSEIFKTFHPKRESFLSNVLELKRSVKTIFSPIRAANKEQYTEFMTNFDVQASAGGSLLEIHYGMLLPPFFIPNYNKLMNHIFLAPFVAHEFGHLIFWVLDTSPQVDKLFQEKNRCLADQYSRFKFDYLNENLNGSVYEIENLPDNIATSLIDKIIEQYSSSQDIILPGLSYSTKQLLYMSASQMWCSKSNLKQELHYKTENHHAPSEFRLSGIMQNSKGYPEAFNCPEGSFMNPQTKCSLLDTKLLNQV